MQTPCVLILTKVPLQIFDKATESPIKINPSLLFFKEEISQIIQKKWENNFVNKIGLVGGEVWRAGNLSYHLKDRPVWDDILENTKTATLKNNEDGFILIGDAATLSKICSGVFVKIKMEGVCMIGKKK